ncbi:uncharacterized protein FFB20_11827 [Fusarium fujikuroi]|nr:uncharacterized protein FFE2_05293 [Fusarium fujikuroi]SCN83886.1 uncharacterized protein FFC1_04351 [Fusarium fujikuroi]SCO03024.1 uncharacterized protein FFB20_11827 [Fusarium fujikuroi]SCO34972.1 uncharacterized protein FFNC_04150 [Fusarium fujikuroi]SCO49627.1 uncharacterized protein FFMR_09764 [Fusarium fujikuroi]
MFCGPHDFLNEEQKAKFEKLWIGFAIVLTIGGLGVWFWYTW